MGNKKAKLFAESLRTQFLKVALLTQSKFHATCNTNYSHCEDINYPSPFQPVSSSIDKMDCVGWIVSDNSVMVTHKRSAITHSMCVVLGQHTKGNSAASIELCFVPPVQLPTERKESSVFFSIDCLGWCCCSLTGRKRNPADILQMFHPARTPAMRQSSSPLSPSSTFPRRPKATDTCCNTVLKSNCFCQSWSKIPAFAEQKMLKSSIGTCRYTELVRRC